METPKNPKLIVTLLRQNTHLYLSPPLPRVLSPFGERKKEKWFLVNSAFASVTSLDF